MTETRLQRSCPEKITKFVPITYRIGSYYGDTSWYVDGYAFEVPAPFHRLHFCVRKDGREWTIDHFESGYAIGGPVTSVTNDDRKTAAYIKRWQIDRRSRARAVAWLLRYLPEAYKRGRMREGFERNGFGWCFEEAGL